MLLSGTVDASSGGILVAVDGCQAAFATDQAFHALNVALDPDGETNLTYHYPDEPWRSVWLREAEPLWQLCRAHRVIFLIVPEGQYSLVVTDGDIPHSLGLPPAADFEGLLAGGAGAFVAGLDDSSSATPACPSQWMAHTVCASG